MRQPFVACIIAGSLLVGASPRADGAQWETSYVSVPSSDGALETSRFLASLAHYPGSPGDYLVAVYLRDRMRSFGLQARLESFTATVYTPKLLELELLRPSVFHFDLRDPVIPGDATAKLSGIGLPFNAGSGSGDVTAPAVDVGKGLGSDYARIRAAGRDVRGKIALIRYGAEYRGNLAARAARNGAVGVIFFTDPAQDKGPAYPAGPYPSDATIQRGVVMGPDLKPLVIPTLPISAANARRIIAVMRSGQTVSPVRLHVVMNARQTTLWNAIGEIAGTDPSQSVILGGHRDAWVAGVSDDGSGIATLTEVARGLGSLRRAGWTPRRTIVIAGWDAEEIGGLGSAAFVTAHRSSLERGCIAYINTDESASGPDFHVAAAAAIADELIDPVHSVLRIAQPHVDAPGGGSDFDSFIYTVGTPIVDTGYTGPLGTYHSPYDDLQYAQRFGDPGFIHHRSIAQLIGVVAMRLATSPHPLRFSAYVTTLNAGLTALTTSARRSHRILDISSLRRAVERVEENGRRADRRTAPEDASTALAAARQLNLIAYSANGYAAVAFPAVTQAIADGDQLAIDRAVRQTTAALDRVARLLASLD